jgi:hypothetical protein
LVFFAVNIKKKKKKQIFTSKKEAKSLLHWLKINIFVIRDETNLNKDEIIKIENITQD